jgi:phage shock protein B
MEELGTLAIILFLAVVAPVWIAFHYLTRWRTARTLSRDDERTLVDLWESARRMESRIENLERAVGVEAKQEARNP